MDHRHKHASVSESLLRPVRWIATFILGVSLLVPRTAQPAEPTTAKDVVASVQATYAKVTAVRADFTQVTTNMLTGVEEKKRGRIQLERPRKMRLELGLPLEFALVSDGVTQWVYSAPQKQLLVQKVLGTSSSGSIDRLIDDLGQLSDLFEVALLPPTVPPKPIHVLILKPKTPNGVKRLELVVKKQSYLLQDLILTDANDGVTKMGFTGVVLGGDVPDALFAFKAPPGVTVVNQ